MTFPSEMLNWLCCSVRNARKEKAYKPRNSDELLHFMDYNSTTTLPSYFRPWKSGDPTPTRTRVKLRTKARWKVKCGGRRSTRSSRRCQQQKQNSPHLSR